MRLTTPILRNRRIARCPICCAPLRAESFRTVNAVRVCVDCFLHIPRVQAKNTVDAVIRQSTDPDWETIGHVLIWRPSLRQKDLESRPS